MAEQTEKWVAGFDYNENVIVAKARFRKTAKLMIFEHPTMNDEEKRAHLALGYKSQFTHREAEKHLFDTPQEALDALHQRYEEKIEGWEQYIEADRTKLNLIDDFGTTL